MNNDSKKPFNIGIAYAYVKNTWVCCVSQYHTFLQGHSEKELMLASKEIRRQNQLHTKNRTVTARRLADFSPMRLSMKPSGSSAFAILKPKPFWRRLLALEARKP